MQIAASPSHKSIPRWVNARRTSANCRRAMMISSPNGTAQMTLCVNTSSGATDSIHLK